MLLLLSSMAGAQTARVTTSQYNARRTGANENETVLTPENVNAKTFGKVMTFAVDGAVFAQPLYLPDVAVPGKGTHNLLFVETERDTVYAFDADAKSTQPIWQVSLLPKGEASFPVSASAVQCPFISPVVGITSTPVIDVESGMLYVLARSGSRANFVADTRYAQHLHALAITTGHEKFAGPVEIRASVPGTGEGSSGGAVEFDPLRENPRASLLLVNGVVYLTWGSSCDVSPYHGWVMAYDARTLKQLAAFNTSPNAGESGVWQSDTGPAADEQGNVYVATGNGLFDAGSGHGQDYGDSILKLKLQGNRLALADYFTPTNQDQLNATDGDLGSGGPVLLPNAGGNGSAGLVFGGKQGVLYDVDPAHLGGLQTPASSGAAHGMKISTGIYAAAAYWNGNLYTFASEDALKQFAVARGRLAKDYSARSREKSAYSGGTPTVSANGKRNGIVWVVESRAWNEGGSRAVLRAYDARNVARLLYSSEENPKRDDGGEAVRFAMATIANGRVYVGGVNTVSVYGLLSK